MESITLSAQAGSLPAFPTWRELEVQLAICRVNGRCDSEAVDIQTLNGPAMTSTF